MRKRLRWTIGTAFAALMVTAATAYAVVGPAADGNTQDMTASITPKKLSKSAFQPVTLKVTTDTETATAPNGVPVAATRAVLDFDKNAKLSTKGIPTCDAASLQNLSTADAKAACPNSIVGSGSATVLIPVGTQVFTEPVTVTAFNGVPQGGKPVLLLDTYGAAPVQVAIVLIGKISNYGKQGYGPRLDVAIPPIAGGTGALTKFETTVKRSFNYKGQKRSYVSAKCPNSKKLKARGAFTYADGQSLTVGVSQSCGQKK